MRWHEKLRMRWDTGELVSLPAFLFDEICSRPSGKENQKALEVGDRALLAEQRKHLK